MLATLWIFPAGAHTSAKSEVRLEATETGIAANVAIPAAEYAYASGNKASNDVASLADAKRYLRAHTAIRSADGPAWKVAIGDVRFAENGGAPDLLAQITYDPPAGAASDRFDLQWSAVIANTPDHVTQVVLDKNDLSGPRLIGLLREGNTKIAVVAGKSSTVARFVSAIRVGAEHILGGLDHLAFLVALLLAAPLLARNGQWQSLRSGKEAIVAVAKLASGFTIGHSITLISVALTGLTLPGSAVEVFIAATILIAAFNVIRPIFAQRELWIAVLFGLVHGLGFAGFVREADADLTRNVSTLMGFNVGLELVQIVVILAVIPVLLFIARRGFYSPFRITAGTVLIASSGFWMVTRTLDAVA
ncbi:HupE/UreJ family protein [Citromicrobium bathyomarinum]|uniref:HupE/UreJ family protein n=1 Tax=Citromicrobium bathyomarinum TaxID=72174 RepID=UPI00315A61FD